MANDSGSLSGQDSFLQFCGLRTVQKKRINHKTYKNYEPYYESYYLFLNKLCGMRYITTVAPITKPTITAADTVAATSAAAAAAAAAGVVVKTAASFRSD